jgi:hypothetical protein
MIEGSDIQQGVALFYTFRALKFWGMLRDAFNLRHSWASALLNLQRLCGHVWVLVVPSSCVACCLAC